MRDGCRESVGTHQKVNSTIMQCTVYPCVVSFWSKPPFRSEHTPKNVSKDRRIMSDLMFYCKKTSSKYVWKIFLPFHFSAT